MPIFKTDTRIQLVGLLFLLVIGAIITKLWWMQIVHGNFYVQKIRGNSQVTVRIPSVRGEIRDRNGLTLVANRAIYELDFYLPEMVKGYKRAFGSLPYRMRQYTVKGLLQENKEVDINRVVQDTVAPRLEDLGIEQEYNAKTLQTHYRNDTLVPFTFTEDLTFGDMAKLSERDLGLPGVEVTVKPVRQYLYGSLAAHILGYVGPIDTDRPDIKQEAKQFTFYQADVEGKNNVEALMDSFLRGKPGIRYVRRNAKGVIEGDESVTPPTPGANVYLTIDARIQTIAERALRIAGRGAAVVVDPNNGDILAMASVPSFDPNNFIPSISSTEWSKIIHDETNPLTNRALLSYAPGSIFKTVTSLAGIRKGIGKNKYTCTGGVTYGDKYMRCWIADRGGHHGTLTLPDAIKVSCNAFFYQYGNAATIQQIDYVGQLLGIGQLSCIGLSNESPGILPGPEWLRLRNPHDRWSQGYTANVAIGQGSVQTSPLQMVMVAATLANGGTCYYPNIIEKIVDKDGPEGKVLFQKEPKIRTELLKEGMPADQIEMVRKGMWNVVNADGGTAGRARLDNGIQVAGKTGTAQFWRNGKKDNHTWFISFAPYKEPKYAVCVFLQGAKAGGTTAAPIAARILEECFALDSNKLEVEVKPLPPAVGNFAFIESVNYKSATPLVTGVAPSANEGSADTADGNNAIVHKNEDAPSQDNAARPNVREEPDVRIHGRRGRSSAGGRNREGNFTHSLRKFFSHDANGDNNNDSDQDRRKQQNNLRRQRDQQRRQRNQEPASRKKVFGIF